MSKSESRNRESMVSQEGGGMPTRLSSIFPNDTTSSSEVNKDGAAKGAHRMSLLLQERNKKDKQQM